MAKTAAATSYGKSRRIPAPIAKPAAQKAKSATPVSKRPAAPAKPAIPACDPLSLYFDHGWYLETYEDVANAGVDPAQHYRTAGFREGRQPNPYFNGKSYLAANPDLTGFEGNPFEHYVFYGAAEGRPIR